MILLSVNVDTWAWECEFSPFFPLGELVQEVQVWRPILGPGGRLPGLGSDVRPAIPGRVERAARERDRGYVGPPGLPPFVVVRPPRESLWGRVGAAGPRSCRGRTVLRIRGGSRRTSGPGPSRPSRSMTALGCLRHIRSELGLSPGRPGPSGRLPTGPGPPARPGPAGPSQPLAVVGISAASSV